MSARKKAHFDDYARDYNTLHKDSISASGEEPSYFAAYKIEYMFRFLGAPATQKLSILDFGCGVGGSLTYLRQFFQSADLYGVDVSHESIAIAKQNHPGANLDTIREGRINLPDDSIDFAMAACVYHHIPPAERAAWTAEIKRVVKPGGRFFIFEHNPLNPLTQRVVKNCAFDDDAILLPRRESLTLLAQAGMHDVSAQYIVFFPKFASALRPWEKYLGWLPLGAQYVARACV